MGKALSYRFWLVIIALRMATKEEYVFSTAPEWVLDTLIDALVEQHQWYWVNKVREELEWRIYKEGLTSCVLNG